MIDVVEILEHWHAGRPNTVIAASVGVDRGTIARYVAPAIAAGITPGGARLSRSDWLVLVQGWHPKLIDAKARSFTYPVINAHRALIEVMLETNTVTTAHQRMRDDHSLDVKISSFRRYVQLEFPAHVDAASVTLWRPEVPAGEEAQID